MRKILRSIIWIDPTERPEAKANYAHIQYERLLNHTTAEGKLLQHLLDFYQQHAEAPQLQIVIDHFESIQENDVLALLEEVQTLSPYIGGSFQDLFEEEVETQAAQYLVSVTKVANKIATQGHQIGKAVIKGTDAAVSYLYSSIKEKPKDSRGRPPANMKASQQHLMDLYEDRKSNPHKTYGVLTSYGFFDAATAGIRKKQFYLHVGFGGHLKSTFMMNTIVNAAVEGGWNPLLFTSEMPAEEVKMMLAGIHSANPKFNSVHKPLNVFRLILGALNPTEEQFYKEVYDDLVNNPQHGSIRVIDSGEFTTWGSVMQRTVREYAEEEVDILWCDYITRLPIDAKYHGMDITSARNETLADAKRFAMSFNGGKGLAVCSPFQMNREGYKKAQANGGRIDKTAMAQYNAAEREADIISYIFYDKEEIATSEPKVGLIKSRWGKADADPVPVFIEPDSRRIFDLTAGMNAHTGYSPTAGANAADEVVL